MPTTFETAWRRVLLHAPEVPVFLARDFVQQAFARLSEDRPWVWQRKATQLTVLASRVLVVGATLGSATLTSAAAFVASDAGRQITLDGLPQPIYTILTYTSASAVTLDQPVVTATNPIASATLSTRYVTAPTDFGAWLSIVDPSINQLIPFDISLDEIDRQDPQRTSVGDPARALAPARPSILAATLGQLLFEWWPAPTAARTYQALYRARPATLADGDFLPGVLGQRSDLLVTGALMECAKWPGTRDRPNPYFNLQTYQVLSREFQAERIKLALRDDDQLGQDWVTTPMRPAGLAATDRGLRASDADLGDYY